MCFLDVLSSVCLLWKLTSLCAYKYKVFRTDSIRQRSCKVVVRSKKSFFLDYFYQSVTEVSLFAL